MNKVLETAVRNSVYDHLNGGVEFTAYSITKAVREKGLYAPHQEVREIVHGMYANGEMQHTADFLADGKVKIERKYAHFVTGSAICYSIAKVRPTLRELLTLDVPVEDDEVETFLETFVVATPLGTFVVEAKVKA